MTDKKISLAGAIARTKLSRSLVNQIGRMTLSTEGQSIDDSREALDNLILRAREINATAAKDEVL